MLRRNARVLGLLSSIGLLSSSAAKAVPVYSPSSLASLTDASVKTLIQTVAVGADYRSYSSASPLGLLGFDLGVDVTAIKLPSEFSDALKLAGVNTNIPALLPLPRLSLHKGLPHGLGFGFSYFGYQDYRIVGGELSWAFLHGKLARPSMAIRFSDNYTKLFFMSTHTIKTDLVISKRLAYFFDPYVGGGMQFEQGDISVPVNAPGGASVPGLPSSVSSHQSASVGHVFIGMPIRILLLQITAEYDHSLSGINTFGGKIAFAF